MKGFAAKRRKYQRILVILLLPALVLFHFTTPVSAWGSLDGYEYFWADSTYSSHYKLTGGLASVYYSWYNPNNYTTYNGTSYHVQVVTAANSWENALTNDLGTDFISTGYLSSNTNVYYVLNNTLQQTDIYAGCVYFNSYGVAVSNNQTYGEPWSDYAYVYVICYNQNMNRSNNSQNEYQLNDVEVKGVMAHEMGHAMGLAHVYPDGFNVLMEENHVAERTYAPTSYDIAGIRNAGY